MNCPKCGTPNASYVNEKGESRKQRRISHKGSGGKGASVKGTSAVELRRGWVDDKIKCRKCGII